MLKEKQIYEMEIDVDDFNKERFKSSAKVYGLIFNFCLRKMIDSLNAPSKTLYKKEHESITFNRLSHEVHKSIDEESCTYLGHICKFVHVSLINNAIMSSVGFFNKWKRGRRKLGTTIPFPNGIPKRCMRYFVIGSEDYPISFSPKGLYLRRLARFKVLGSYEEKGYLMGTYSKVRIFYKNLTCKWYCQFNIKNKKD